MYISSFPKTLMSSDNFESFESQVIGVLSDVTQGTKVTITPETRIRDLHLTETQEGRVLYALEGPLGISEETESDLLDGDPTVASLAEKLRQKFSDSVTVQQ